MTEVSDHFEPKHLRQRWLEFLGVSAFALLQPLLDVVGQHADFLVVHGVTSVRLVLWFLVWALVPPTALWVVGWALSLASQRLGSVVHAHLLGTALGVVLLTALDLESSLVTCWLAVVAAGLAFSLLYTRWTWIRRFLGVLWLAIPVFLVLFLGRPGVRQIMGASDGTHASTSGAEPKSVPVFVVVLDEIPMPSLLTSAGTINRDLYPSFHRLSTQSIWYPNATTVSGATLRSISAIVSGRLPGWRQPPTSEAFPFNLFTVTQHSHTPLVYESSTEFLADDASPRATHGWRPLLLDSAVVAGHAALPPAMREQLPSIEHRWGGFVAETSGRPVTRTDKFRTYLDQLGQTRQPPLGFAHSLVTHTPFKRLPDGTLQCWCSEETLIDGAWPDDLALVKEAYLRHLVQLMHGDLLVGEWLDRLESLGLFDDALIVVTSDHGASFRPGENIRISSRTNVLELMSIPLFIKLPGQSEGVKDLRHAQTTDIFPTILDILEVEIPEDMDGRSLLDGTWDREVLTFLAQDVREKWEVAASDLASLSSIVELKEEWFGDARSLRQLMGWDEWEGVDVSSADPHPQAVFTLDRAKRYRNVDPASWYVPTRVEGSIQGLGGEPTEIMVTVNGVPQNAGELFLPHENSARRFAVTVPRAAFRAGANAIELLARAGSGPWLQVPAKEN